VCVDIDTIVSEDRSGSLCSCEDAASSQYPQSAFITNPNWSKQYA
jgi:hypothetical protein